MNRTRFISPTKGPLDLDQIFADIVSHVETQPQNDHKIIVGTDSQNTRGECDFVTAIIIHRVGKGARYYYRKIHQKHVTSLKQRIFYEASLSLETAGRLAGMLAKNGHSDLNVEIHLDVGEEGQTKELIREIVGMVIGSGFNAKIKPDSYGASKVADKHTK
ncbi:MAG: ribonuclease H-like YkuK family protein [Firmicutes bacterium]|nr:ribonuclease H-like YkuK family protein [Bacillota bacterium]